MVFNPTSINTIKGSEGPATVFGFGDVKDSGVGRRRRNSEIGLS